MYQETKLKVQYVPVNLNSISKYPSIEIDKR